MYRPTEPGETVETVQGPGTYTGTSNSTSESYQIELENGESTHFHYEDLDDPNRIRRFPLGPEENPTTWLEIRKVDTYEKYHISFILGRDPWDPFKIIRLNKEEAFLAMEKLEDSITTDEDGSRTLEMPF